MYQSPPLRCVSEQRSSRLHFDLYECAINSYLIATVISQDWNALSPAQKQPWKDLAKEEARLFKLRHPNYKFKPRASSTIKKRVKKSKKSS